MENSLVEEFVQNYIGKNFEIKKLDGGWRKETFLLSGSKKIVLSFADKKNINWEKFIRGIKMEEEAGAKKFLTRKYLQKGKWKNYFWVTWVYLEGENKWHWGIEESAEVGNLCARLHQSGINHMDLKPGNILWKQNKIVGLIDFEESNNDKNLALEDILNTLSWVIVSGGNQEAFLRGYEPIGGKIDSFKINNRLIEFLNMRANEGSNEAMIILAKKRLETYQNEVKEKLYKIDDLKKIREKYKSKKIVFTVGAFDLLHWGHFDYLKKAKKNGDILIVGVASDDSRRRLKGEGFPLVGDKTRSETLCFFGDLVDGVVVIDEDGIMPVLKELKPDILVTTQKDWYEGLRKPEEEEFVKNHKGKVVKINRFALKVSSSQITKQVALNKAKQILLGHVQRQPMLKIRKKNVIKKEVKYEDLEKLGEKLKKEGKSVLFVSLSADLFHLGHARFIQRAKSLADVLVAGLPSNANLTALKGPGRPMVDETSRALVLSELSSVDHVVIFDDRTVLGCLKRLKPDIFFTVEEDWNSGFAQSAEAQFMKSINGKMVRAKPQAPYISATKIINRAASELIKRKFTDLLKVDEPVLNADFDPFSPEAQLTAREKGFYDQVWKEATSKKCVFCDLKDKYIIAKKDGVVLTVTLFPYIDGHLLIIPERHVESIDELNDKEQAAIFELSRLGVRILKDKMGIENCWILVREGDGIKAGKTVLHLHYHILPYDQRVVKMGETKLSMTPLELVKKLKDDN